MFIRTGAEFQQQATRTTPRYERRMAEFLAIEKAAREERERKFHITTSLNKAEETQSVSLNVLDGIFKPGAPILAATRELIGGKEANDKTTLVLDRPASTIKYINIADIPGGNSTLSNSLRAIDFPNPEQCFEPSPLHQWTLRLNNLLKGAAASPTAEKAAKIAIQIKEKTPVVAEKVNDIAINKVAPNVINGTHKAVDTAKKLYGSTSQTQKKWASGLVGMFALASCAQPLIEKGADFFSSHAISGKKSISIEIPEATPASCTFSMPVIFNGANQAFSLRYEKQCDWLKSMTPEDGETLPFGDYASITGTKSGDIIHSLNGSKMRVPKENWRAAVEGLMATGAMDKPRIFAVDYINMLRQESGIGTNTLGSGTTSCGAAQVTLPTFGTWIRKYGPDHNYGWLAAKYTKLGQEIYIEDGKKRSRFSDKKLVRQDEYKSDFRKFCGGLSFSFTLGARNYLDANTEWQDKVNSGKARLPFGLTKVNNRIAYFSHFTGMGGAIILANRMADHPDWPMDKLLSGKEFRGTFASNKNVFVQRTPEKDLLGNYKRDDKGKLVMSAKHVITGREFYEWIGRHIGLSETPHPAQKDPRGFVASDGIHVAPKAIPAATFDIRDSDPEWAKHKQAMAAKPLEQPYISNYDYMKTVTVQATVSIP